MIDDGIRQLLVTAPAGATVAALISTRMYPLVLPEPCTYPAATYQLISNIEENTLDAGAVSAKARVQIESWGTTLLEAQTVAKAIRAVLKDFAGALPNGVNVVNAWRDNVSSGFDQDTQKYYVQSDYMVLHDDV